MNTRGATYKTFIIILLVLGINNSYAQDCGCTNCPVFLPDDVTTLFQANITVDNTTNNTLGADNWLEQVCIDIDHTWVGDLDMTLIAPDGTSVLLYADGNNDMSLGGTETCDCGNLGDDINICFVLPGGATNIFGSGAGCTLETYQDPCNGGTPCYTGNWGTFDEGCGGGMGLGSFNNGTGTVSGDWQLLINDNAGGDQGVLNDVTLVFATPPTGDCTTDPVVPPSGACQNTTTVSIPDNTGTPAFSIIDNDGSAGTMGGGTELLSACILIDHTWIGDLDVWLYEPDGTGINLSNANGGSGDDYGDVASGTEVCFTATAANPITGYTAGDLGEYTPEQPFSNFNGDPNGQWTLAVWDGAGADIGNIISWSLTFDNGDCSDQCIVTGSLFDEICQGENYDFNGTIITAGGIYTDTLPGAGGCDSVITLNLTEHTLQSGTFDTTVCNGETIVFNGTTYGGSTFTGTEIFTDANGCDSSVAVTVTEFPVQSGTFDTTVCSGETFIFNGNTYGGSTFAGTEIFTDANGCDSSVAVMVTEFPVQSGTFDTTVCSGETFVFNGNTYGGSTLTGTEIFTDANGCDSSVAVTVTEFPVQSGTFDTTVCSGETFVFNGNTYGGSTFTGTEIFTDANGCDSSVAVTVTEFPAQSGTFDTTVCSGETFIFNGNTYGGSTFTGTEIFTDANGCDSSVAVTVTEFPVQSGTFDTTVCSGETFVFNGNTYGAATFTGTEIFTDANGCDSSVAVTVTEFPVQSGTFDTTVCSGETFVFNGNTYGGSTFTGTEIFTDANGCDSSVAVTVTEFPVQSGTFDTTVCSGETFVFNGNTYGAATFTGTEIFTDANGCDSSVAVTVTEFPVQSGTFDTTVCSGETFVFNGNTYGGSTLTGTEIFTDANGCDSSVAVTVTEFPVQSGTFDTTVCSGETFVFNGNTYGGSTLTGTEIFTDANGCDSSVAVMVTEFPVQSGTFDTTVCSGETFVFNGNTYGGSTLTGTEIFTDANGCDSSVAVTVTEFPVQSGTFDTTVCSGETFVFNGTTYGGSTFIGTEIFTDANGCDSSVAVTVTEFPVQSGTFDTTVCSGETFVFNGNTYGGSTFTGTEIFTDANGCDSSVAVMVTEFPVQSGTFDTTVCSGETFVFNGNTYGGSAFTGTEIFTDANGCDSSVAVTVTEFPVQSGTFDTTVCSGETFVFNGTTYGGSTFIGTEIFTDVNGCDSSVAVTVTEFPVQSGTFDTTVCSGETFVFNGTTYGGTNFNGVEVFTDVNGCDSAVAVSVSEYAVYVVEVNNASCDPADTGTVINILNSINGCDSVVTTNTALNPSYDLLFINSSCDPADTGTVINNQVTVDGCDSIITTVTTLNPRYDILLTNSSCDPQDTGTVVNGLLTINGCDSIITTITSLVPTYDILLTNSSCDPADTGTVVFSGVAIGGCDSIVTTITSLDPTYNFTINASSCDPADTGIVVSNQLTVDGCDSIITTVTILNPSYDILLTGGSCDPQDTGTVVNNLSTIDGCDSIITTVTTLFPSYDILFTNSSCNPQDTGTAVNALTTIDGCDSIITTITTLNPSYDIVLTNSSCNPSDTGTVVYGLLTVNGCDSIITTITTLNPSYDIVLTNSSCNPVDTGTLVNGLLTVDGCDSIITTITTLDPSYDIVYNYTTCNPADSGILVQSFLTIHGCDSTITTITTLDQFSSGSSAVTICSGDSASINGIDFYSVQGVYQDTIPGYNCDSVVTLDLVVDVPPNSSSSATLCPGESFNLNGIDYDSTGTYVIIIPGGAACDEILTLSVNVLPFAQGQANLSLCVGDSASINGQEYFNQTGVYTDTIPGSFCDSIVTLNLTIAPWDSIFIDKTTCDPTEAGVVVMDLSNTAGCDSVVTITTHLSPISIALIDPEDADCNGENGEVFIVPGSGFPPFQYEISGGSSYVSASSTPIGPLDAGEYSVTLTDSMGCIASDTFSIGQEPLFSFGAVQNAYSIFYGESAILEVSPDTGNITWSPPSFLSCDTCAITTSTPEYSINYIVTSQAGVCLVSDTISIEVIQPELLVPSAFTPNGDGTNDEFHVIDHYIDEFVFLRVFNRWGEMLFESSDIETGWNGFYNGELQEMDSYIYHVLVVLKTGRVADVSGNFILLR